MSKKYSTEELVKGLVSLRDFGGEVSLDIGVDCLIDTIIARLRAGDKLCEETKEADAVICRLCKAVNPQHSKCTSCEDRESRAKAIAEFEGK